MNLYSYVTLSLTDLGKILYTRLFTQWHWRSDFHTNRLGESHSLFMGADEILPTFS